ncbi:MAG: AMP-binding protein, partial [Bacteroidaceae bacterium]|nr:AMP-binding protein [Bacteroidaceae bacterium]
YASTETGIVCSYNFNDGRTKPGCCGPALLNSQVFITEEGTIACKGSTLMSGYMKEPELTAAVLKDGCIYTADSGYLDDEGMLHVQGRNDDIINIGGYKVDPVEVENRALAFDGVQDCICIADTHPVVGNILKLLVKTNGNKPLDNKQIARFIAQTLEPYKVPVRYECVETINRTPNGKLDRKSYRTK